MLSQNRHNNKLVDLSITCRLSNLPSGAKLELVLSSRSPSVVSVALQLPQSEPDGSNRLTAKFASNSTLWKILRTFESQPDGKPKNFTGRGLAVPTSQSSGTPDIYYETPALLVMGRELSSFVDLQRTLAQLGFNNGSALLRLSFKKTDTPLEQAMQQISLYFGPAVDDVRRDNFHEMTPRDEIQAPAEPLNVTGDSAVHNLSSDQEDTARSAHPIASSDIGMAKPEGITILAAPSSTGVQPAYQAHDEKDFIPTIDHARLHQARLATAGTNKRLLSDAELAAQALASKQRLESVNEVEIKVRFPDQMQIVRKFLREATAHSLYDFVQSVMARDHEPFHLSLSTSRGPHTIPPRTQADSNLITGLGMTGKVLVNFIWGDGATLEARQTPVLKIQYREQAQEMVINPLPSTVGGESVPPPNEADIKPDKERKGGIPKWLKLGKK